MRIGYPLNETERILVVYENVPVLSATIATTYVGKNVTEFALRIDIDGDNVTDMVVSPTLVDGVSGDLDRDGDGKITVLDSRKLVLLCTRPRCATQ